MIPHTKIHNKLKYKKGLNKASKTESNLYPSSKRHLTTLKAKRKRKSNKMQSMRNQQKGRLKICEKILLQDQNGLF